MELNGDKSNCGKSLGSHQAALLQTFDNSLEGLSLRPSFKDGLGWQNPYGKPPVHYSGPRMLVDFLKSQDSEGDYSNDKSNDANQEQSIKHDKARQPNGSNMKIQPKHGQLIIYLPSILKKITLVTMKADGLSKVFGNQKHNGKLPCLQGGRQIGI
jgi:hypothetical protein